MYLRIMKKETKPIRISSSIHKKLRVYAAKTDVNIVDVVNKAVSNFMKQFPAFLHNKTKSNDSKIQ